MLGTALGMLVGLAVGAAVGAADAGTVRGHVGGDDNSGVDEGWREVGTSVAGAGKAANLGMASSGSFEGLVVTG